MDLIISSLKVSFILSVLVVVSKAQSGYYWRDYTDELPDDAVPAGTDAHGQHLYIGLGIHTSPLPGTIRPEQKLLSYEFGNQEYLTIADVKILCSLYPKRFRWVKTSAGNLASTVEIVGTNLIRAGSDTNRPLVVGRISLSEHEVLIGKILNTNGTLSGIWAAKDGRTFYQDTYEILIYDLNIPAQEEIICRKTPVVINLYE